MFLLKKSNKIYLIFIFLIIFIYFIYYPDVSTKYDLMQGGVDQELKIDYGLWGYINDYIYKFLDLLLGSKVTGLILVEYILAFQKILLYLC